MSLWAARMTVLNLVLLAIWALQHQLWHYWRDK